jgi:choline dehydrogenase-like flavoprotein
MLCGTQSRGSIRLNSSDPHVKPKIDHNYLANELDVAVLAEGCRYVNEVVTEGAGTREHIAGPWPPTRVHPNGDEQWKEYVRQQAGTCYHPASTCKMGPDEDEEAAVDPRLRVRGVRGLRVAGALLFSFGLISFSPSTLNLATSDEDNGHDGTARGLFQIYPSCRS